MPPSDCAIQYPDPLSEAYKQCVCEEDPDNCPENVLYFFHSDQQNPVKAGIVLHAYNYVYSSACNYNKMPSVLPEVVVYDFGIY